MRSKRKRFISYYNTYFEKIYRYIFFRSGRDRALAEDLTSEVMLKAYEHFEDFDHSKNFSVWIYRIAHNHLVDYYKKAKKELVAIEDVENELKKDDRIAEKLDDKLSIAQVETVLEMLPEQQKEIILMKYFQELSHKEIADIMDMTEAHVRVQAHRALKTLQKQLSFLTS